MTRLSIRRLDAADARAAETFLARAPDATMYLRSNMRRGGFTYAGKPLQAKYFGAFDGDGIAGIAALCWNGMVLVHAPAGAEPLFLAVVREAMESGIAISGFNGVREHVFAVRGMLDLGALALRHDIDAGLFVADAAAVKMPELFDADGIVLRRPRADDLTVLVDWDIGYRTEAMFDRSAASRRAEIARATQRALERGIDNMWLLERNGVLVARSLFGAALPDAIQVGGVWTPPQERGKGYARAVVAGSVRAVATQGVERVVLFAHDPAAIRAYSAIGFQKVGAYSLVTFAEPVAPERIWRLTNAAPLLRPLAA